jgi:DNA repair photolyase
MRAVSNPPNRFDGISRDYLDGPPPVGLQLYEEETQEILSRNESPDLPFRWSLNPYRGCFHACAYCYARPTHEYWGFGAGTDFESKIVVKVNAATRLQETFLKPSWRGDIIAFSGNTDCYQPVEAGYGLTRACLEVCAEFRNPVGLITKAALIARDIDVLQRLRREAWVRVFFSIPFADNETARKVEPQAPSITSRLDAMRRLAEAGIPTGVSIAPVIPGLNDAAIPEILSRAREAGAETATYMLLRLSGSVEPVFLERMRTAFPERVRKITNRLREVRGGSLTEARFFKRHHGEGAYWSLMEQLFEAGCRKAGFPAEREESIPNTFRRPGSEQMSLFEPPESR